MISYQIYSLLFDRFEYIHIAENREAYGVALAIPIIPQKSWGQMIVIPRAVPPNKNAEFTLKCVLKQLKLTLFILLEFFNHFTDKQITKIPVQVFMICICH